MALTKCQECGSEISHQATTCPKCGRPNINSGAQAASAIVSLILLGGAAWFFFGGGWDSMTQSTLSGIHDQVASDSVAQYNIAAAQGDKMQKCVQAGLVAAAYLQAQDTTNYNIWKGMEKIDCAAAGVPRL